jgi:hypothetical protein
MNPIYSGPALTPGALNRMVNELPIWRPIMQIVQIIEVPSERGNRIQVVLADPQEKYRFIL